MSPEPPEALEGSGLVRNVVLVRRSPAEASAWLDALDGPDATGPDAERWRALGPEAQSLVRELVAKPPGDGGSVR